ncbi:MAG: hypothetical protein PQJ49_08000 [Sphaerochaetaceae bacterium]|nr:hypothetical protein [Sphaerochaetaceae bacterium]
MNWIQVENKLPEFDKVVLLYQKGDDGQHYATVGSLMKIDGEGTHWRTSGKNDVFGDIFRTMGASSMQPSHWAEIIVPQ